MQLIFWHNIISPHQAPFMRELAGSGHDVVVVSTEEMSEDRRLLGWEAPSLGAARVILGPDQTMVCQIIEESAPEAIHFIAGARGTPLGKQAAQACRTSNRRTGIITEAPDTRGIGGFLRRIKYSWERIYTGEQYDFILAMGQMGVRWFRECGYPERMIFPFAYVTEPSSEVADGGQLDTFRILFVGRLVTLKGVDILLRAIAKAPGTRLEIVGDGPEGEHLQQLATSLGIAERVIWLGQMSAQKVQKRMNQSDLLVLPSRKDGWGAVVNEALLSGTPVICSAACGASEVIRYSWLGNVFLSGDVTALADALSKWVARGKRTFEERERVRQWARRIEAPAVAGYIENILEHIYDGGVRPEPPWRD